MTINGTVHKTAFLLLLVMVPAIWTWNMVMEGGGNGVAWAVGGALAGLVVALVTCFKKEWSPVTAPMYALAEGLFIGGISAIYQRQFPGSGIVLQAAMLTFGTLFALLAAYRSGLIKCTQNFRLGVTAATGGIVFFYLITWILSMCGVSVGFMRDASLLSIGISLVVVVVAALNLVLDFDFIEQGSEVGAPKYMEWYAAFGLLVTLVWLYLELLRLLAKLNSRSSD
jgi:uncharacterized YccA/Bax inhibitor family protein